MVSGIDTQRDFPALGGAACEKKFITAVGSKLLPSP